MNSDPIIDFTEAAIGEGVTKYLFAFWALLCIATLTGVVVVPVFIPFYWLWYKPRYREFHSIELSERSVNIRKGVIFRNEIYVPLDRITDVTVSQGPLMRWAGVYGIKIESAGQTTPDGGANMVVDRDPRTFREAVLDRAEAVKSGEVSATQRESSDTEFPQEQLLTEIRDILKRIEERS